MRSFEISNFEVSALDTARIFLSLSVISFVNGRTLGHGLFDNHYSCLQNNLIQISSVTNLGFVLFPK